MSYLKLSGRDLKSKLSSSIEDDEGSEIDSTFLSFKGWENLLLGNEFKVLGKVDTKGLELWELEDAETKLKSLDLLLLVENLGLHKETDADGITENESGLTKETEGLFDVGFLKRGLKKVCLLSNGLTVVSKIVETDGLLTIDVDIVVPELEMT